MDQGQHQAGQESLLKPPDRKCKANRHIAVRGQSGNRKEPKISKEDRDRKNIRWHGNLKEKEPRRRAKIEEISHREDPDLEKTVIDNHVSIVYTLGIMQTVIHIKSDKEVKENAQRAAKELGLTLSDVINASLRNFIRTREVIFSHTPRMTPKLEKIIAKVEKDIKSKKNIYGPFHGAKEANEFLDSL